MPLTQLDIALNQYLTTSLSESKPVDLRMIMQSLFSGETIAPELSSNLSFIENSFKNQSELLINQCVTDYLKSNMTLFYRAFCDWFEQCLIRSFALNDYPESLDMLLVLISKIAAPYDDFGGQSFTKLLDAIAQSLLSFVDTYKDKVLDKTQNRNALERLQQDIGEIIKENQASVKQFEQKVIESESQRWIASTSKQLIKDTIYSLLSNKRLPVFFVAFIEEQWTRLTHLNILKSEHLYNEESIKEHPHLLLLNQLLPMFDISDAADVQAVFSKDIIPIFSEIRNCFSSMIVNEREIDDFIEKLERLFVSLMTNNAEGHYFEWLTMPEFAKSSDHDNYSVSLSIGIHQFKVGSWFAYQTQQRTINCKVAARDQQKYQIVLVNYSGARVAALSYSEVESHFHNGLLVPQNFSIDLVQMVANITDYLDKQTEYKKAAIEQKLQQELREQERKQMELEQFSHKLSSALKLVEQCESGAQFLDKHNEQIIQCMVRLKSSGAWILVDARGVKVAQLLPHEIAHKIALEQLELVSLGESAQARLQDIFSQLRQRK